MTITNIVGASNDDERTALTTLVAIWECGGSYPAELLERLPRRRVEIRVASNADHARLSVIVIENGNVTFHPLGNPAWGVVR
jgi:hypothetical protein